MDKNVDFPVVSLQKKSNESNDIKKDKINSKSTIQKHTHTSLQQVSVKQHMTSKHQMNHQDT